MIPVVVSHARRAWMGGIRTSRDRETRPDSSTAFNAAVIKQDGRVDEVKLFVQWVRCEVQTLTRYMDMGE